MVGPLALIKSWRDRRKSLMNPYLTNRCAFSQRAAQPTAQLCLNLKRAPSLRCGQWPPATFSSINAMWAPPMTLSRFGTCWCWCAVMWAASGHEWQLCQRSAPTTTCFRSSRRQSKIQRMALSRSLGRSTLGVWGTLWRSKVEWVLAICRWARSRSMKSLWISD